MTRKVTGSCAIRINFGERCYRKTIKDEVVRYVPTYCYRPVGDECIIRFIARKVHVLLNSMHFDPLISIDLGLDYVDHLPYKSL